MSNAAMGQKPPVKLMQLFLNEPLGYQVVRQRGSHVRLYPLDDSARKPLTIPRHHELGRGLLRKLLRDAQITPEEFSLLVD